MTLVLFDLPTQIYVCNQYLSKVFEGTDQVVDYRRGRRVKSFSDIQPGKINILPHWRYPIMRGREYDLLWNAASFQEMALKTAKRYLDGAAGARSMFLMHNIKFNGLAPLPGLRGAISAEHIPTHREMDRSLARLALVPDYWLYHDSFWVKRAD